MRKTTQIHARVEKITIQFCDCCHKPADPSDTMDYQEWFSTTISCGYAAILGDGNVYELDLCQECTEKVLGPYLRLRHNYITHEDYNNNNEDTSIDRTTREA